MIRNLNENENNGLVSAEGSSNGIILPCSPEEFGDFLAGLLKSPKELRYYTDRPFEVTADEIADFERLLFQRVGDQQTFYHVETLVSTYYENGVSSHDKSIADFLSHSIIDAALCTKVVVNWRFLVDFPNSGPPQKQEVTLELIAPKTRRPELKTFEINDARSKYRLEGIYLSIKHTHVSFGHDIASLFRVKIETLLLASKDKSFYETGFFNAIWYSVFAIFAAALASLSTSFMIDIVYGEVISSTAKISV